MEQRKHNWDVLQALACLCCEMSLLVGVQVNGQPTPDLDTFLSVVEPLKDGDFARVKVCHLETTQQKVIAAPLLWLMAHQQCWLGLVFFQASAISRYCQLQL